MNVQQTAAIAGVIRAAVGKPVDLRVAWVTLSALLHTDAEVITACLTLATVATANRPAGHEDHMVRVLSMDTAGAVVDDPDAAAAPHPHMRGALAAARVIAATANSDTAMAVPLIRSVVSATDPESACVLHSFLDTLARAAAQALAYGGASC